MGGIFGFASELLFGSPKTPKPDWKQIERLLQMGIDENRFDQNGLFTSQVWDEGKDAVTTTINPAIQGGFDNMVGRVNEGSPEYDRAGQYRELMDAYLGSYGQQERRERPPERDRGAYGSPLGSQADRWLRDRYGRLANAEEEDDRQYWPGGGG